MKLVDFPIADIRVGANDRKAFQEREIVSLAESIRDNGLIHPVTIRPDGTLVAGERRYRAVKHLRWPTIPSLIRDGGDEETSRLKLIENVQRENLNPIEEGEAYRIRMEAFGLDVDQVAAWANMPVARIRQRLSLLGLRDDVVQLVRQGTIGVGIATEFVGLDNNRQGFVLRWLGSSKTPPSSGTVREYCDTLRAQQAQDTADVLFPEDLMKAPPAPPSGPRPPSGTLLTKVLKLANANDRLPVFGPVDGHSRLRGHYATYRELVDYQRRLVEAGFIQEAAVVGTVTIGLCTQNLVAVPFGDDD